jgi:probable biosynthetic protein (TIGR04099 family)
MSYHQTYLATMPQLANRGLSENWILRECGHHHWMELANLFDKPVPEFIDDAGQKTYAAFVALSIKAGHFNVIENQQFSIRGHLSKAGPVKHISHHEVQSNGGTLTSIDMVSTFVFRREKNNNQSVARATMDSDKFKIKASAQSEAFLERSKDMRKGNWWQCLGFYQAARTVLKTIEFHPCPSMDFNGANFLYFANFQAFVDRAEWAWFGVDYALHSREIYFYANINIGDSLRVVLCCEIFNAQELGHWCEIYSGSGIKLADVFTRKLIHSEMSLISTPQEITLEVFS